MTRLLADHMVRTSRRPELIPKDAAVHDLLDFCLQPGDVETPDR